MRLSPFLWTAALLSALMLSPAYETHSFALAVFLIGLCCVLSAGGALQGSGLRMPRTALMGVGFAFWALAFISVVFSETKFESFLYFWFFSALPLSFLSFVFHREPEKFLKTAGIGFGFVVSALAILSLVQFIFIKDMLVQGLVYRPLANPNSLAALLSLGLFGALGWMLGAQNRRHSNVALALSLVLIAALFVTGSKGAFFAAVIVLPVFVALNFTHVKKHWRCMSWVGAGGIVLFVLLAFEKAATPDQLVSLAGPHGLDTFMSRGSIWAGAWGIIKDNFWLGTGIGTFFLYYPQYRGEDFTSAGLMAHNDPLQFWAEMGIAAPVLFYSFVVLAILRTKKALKKLAANDPQRVLITTPFCALGTLILHTHISFHFYVLSILIALGFFLALWFVATEKVLGKQRHNIAAPKNWRTETIWTSVLLLFAVLMGIFLSMTGSEILLQQARQASKAGDMRGFADDINAAAKLSGNMNPRAFVMAASVPVGILEAGQKEPAHFEQAGTLLDRAEKLNPRIAKIFFLKARLAMLAGRGDEAETFLKQALKIDPLYLPVRLMLSELYGRAGRKQERFDILKDGLKWPYRNDIALSYYQSAAQVFLEGGDMVAHAQAMEKMAGLMHEKRKKSQQNLLTQRGHTL